MRALNVATKFENLKKLRAKQWPVFLVGFLSPPQLKNSSNNENTAENTAFWLSVWKKVVFREGNCQENRKLRADPA